MTDTESEF